MKSHPLLLPHAALQTAVFAFGPQSIADLAAQRLAALSGIGWREVPYKGAPQIVQDIINGNVDAYFGLTTVKLGIQPE